MTAQSTPDLEAPATERSHAREVDRIPVEKDVMVWARESARLDEAVAAKKLDISPATLLSWESGTKFPTIKQLRKAAHVYKWPLAVLLLPEPPEDFKSPLDYRSGDADKSAAFSYELTTEIRRAHTQREIMLELQEFAPESVPETTPPPKASANNDSDEIGRSLRNYLGFNDQTPQSTGEGSDSLWEWISAIEERGILVLHLRGIETEEVGGFSISSLPYPVIAINGSDSPRRRLFTLLHELAHIALNLGGQGGVCDLHEVAPGKSKRDKDRLEARCNEIAAATLLPSEKVREKIKLAKLNKADLLVPKTLLKLSQPFGVSSEAFLLRLVSLKIVPKEDYWDVRQKLLGIYKKAMREKKQQQRKSGGGPSYYLVKARTLGHGYIESVLDAYATNAISPIDAANFLEVKYDQISKLAAKVA